MGYSVAEKVEIFYLFLKNNKNKYAARREYMMLYPNRPTPGANTFLVVYRRVTVLKEKSALLCQMGKKI